jgi:hypothetical protein
MPLPRRIGEFKRGFNEGRLVLSIQVMNFLGDWPRR